MKKKEKIVAILNKPHGKGKNRYWNAFFFNTNIQSNVEDFMVSIFVSSNRDYFLLYESDLEVVEKQIPVFYYNSPKFGRAVVIETNVRVATSVEGNRIFVID
jgi:hypothetical protein